MKKLSERSMILLTIWLAVTFSACQTAITDKTCLPKDLKVINVTSNSATFTWTGKAERYELAVGDKINIVAGENHEVAGLEAGKEYYWNVRSIADDGYSDWINGPLFKTEENNITVINAPSDLTVKNISLTTATLNWEGSSSGYELSINDGQTIFIGERIYEAAGLTAHTDNSWKLRACENGTFSEWVHGPSFYTNPDNQTDTEIFVNFAGESAWSPEYVEIRLIDDPYMQHFVFLFAETCDAEKEELPAIRSLKFTCNAYTGTTQYPHHSFYCEYYDNNYMERMIRDSENWYGNWWGEAGTTKITEISNSKVSGNISMKMYDAYAKEVEKDPDPAVKTLIVTFKYVPYNI